MEANTLTTSGTFAETHIAACCWHDQSLHSPHQKNLLHDDCAGQNPQYLTMPTPDITDRTAD